MCGRRQKNLLWRDLWQIPELVSMQSRRHRVIDDDEVTVWLIEAALRSTGKPVSLLTLQSLPILYPYTFTQPLGYVVSNCASLVLRTEGPTNLFVALRESI